MGVWLQVHRWGEGPCQAIGRKPRALREAMQRLAQGGLLVLFVIEASSFSSRRGATDAISMGWSTGIVSSARPRALRQ